MINGDRIAIFYDSDNESLYTVNDNTNSTITLYNYIVPLEVTNPINRFNIRLDRLHKGLECVKDEEWIDVNVDEQSQVCSFKSDNIQFNIKLQDDRSTMVSKIRVPVFKSFSFEHKIEITDALGMKLRKAQTFCKDAGRWTLAQEDSKIYFVFGDTKDTSNSSDTMKILISDSYDEVIPQKTYDDELIKLALSKDDFDININHNGAMFISIDHDNAKLNYITTPLKD